MTPTSSLPLVLAGPILRRLEPQRLAIWLVGSRPLQPEFLLDQAGITATARCEVIPIGEHAFIHLLDIHFDHPLPCNTVLEYDLRLSNGQGIAGWAPHLLYPGASRPNFVLRERLDQLLHGSCRKPHYPSVDGLLCADRLLAADPPPEQRPALLMMTGDQVYADDVAGPMLRAIHELIERLGLFDEALDGALVDSGAELYRHPACYYHRADLLPAQEGNETLRERFFGGKRKPIFSSSNADNHLVTLAEVMAMYLLVWSPTPWTLVAMAMPTGLTDERQGRYRQELPLIEAFRDGLGQVARVMAHLPCLMIFDDHDITDDWNLSAQWEQTAYGHPFSRRIIGNALLGYLLCQGWGNDPDGCAALVERCRQVGHARDELVGDLLRFQGWQYALPSDPPLLVLDTRTRRWRSESSLAKPSGLLDWEALSELQQALLDHPSAIVVSPAPIFGVKLIETVQRVFSALGYPLLVDAENWMAHRGAAQVILNIFRHSRTPGHYVVLSGDVHYSFVYEVLIRHSQRSPHLWQVTSSGIKNEFPRRLLDVLDRLNRWLYSPRSPLNWFTKRRQMEVVPRTPSRSKAGERLWNGAGLGQVFFDEQGRPARVFQLSADGSEATEFVPRND
ncbi:MULTISPECIES: alkaline phosphatase D family protein [unclassified Pseudomonas]|uniref:alkaline phosphatase D family protein n=1 Tax=unclassified Pseudomonas TaxID=196821 RepID=UPI00244C2FC3|nr:MULTISPECIES: alkaline phosphatase D family protein [unclassified Pseudomonas]MDH0302181.1 alkaline phosphatase family protein [Pseudomonas sp. GD04091]MDH1988037.1 alkaline phosphatase family protein [Pseudomonas sp. GD03689]